jgi:hypothetical protein
VEASRWGKVEVSGDMPSSSVGGVEGEDSREKEGKAVAMEKELPSTNRKWGRS